jgi:formylglycine-generating enzyme required for sulfatase activity
MRTLWVALLLALAAGLAGASEPPYPLWDGQEKAAVYALRNGLAPTQTVDLGGGVTMELVLIPAGKFIMGTPEPVEPDEFAMGKEIVLGKAVLAASIGTLLVMIAVIIIRAVRERHPPQYSLRRFIVMIFVMGCGVMGGMHWYTYADKLAKEKAEYPAAEARYQEAEDWEKPAHEVTIGKPFYMGKFEVTQEQYQQVMGANPSRFKGAKLPVEMVSWDDAREFCNRASAKCGLTLRLPSEAEWEYACRAGTRTNYHSGDTAADLARAAWYDKNSGGTTHPVGQKEANVFGLHDMHGNVWEWCEDDWHENYQSGPTDGQAWVETPRQYGRVLRGGDWGIRPGHCRSADRIRDPPDGRSDHYGFRVVRSGQK